MNVIELADQQFERIGDYQSLVFEGREYRRAELRGTELRLAQALNELGLRPGDRVAVITPNCPEVYVIYSATWRAGGVTVPILFLLALSEMQHILGDSEPRLVFTSPEFLSTVQQAIAPLARKPEIIIIGDAPPGVRALSDLTASSDETEWLEPRQGHDLSAILYTGGTTGQPKGVMLTHGGMIGIVEPLVEAAELDDGKVSLIALPLAHAYGIVTHLVGMKIWATAVLMRWFEPEAAMRLIQDYHIQWFSAVPTMLVYMLRHQNFDNYDLSSLERIGSAAAPCPVELLEEAERRFGCRVFEGYGMTESTIACSTQRPSQPIIRGSVGKPIPGVTVKIFDDQDRELAPHEVGEICINGPNVMPGYYRMPELTAQAVRGGWLHTGDAGKMDADGNLFVVDRKKDLIIRGGLNIYPRDIEEVLHQHTGVVEAAAVGRPDELYGEEVVAFVVPRPEAPPTAEDLIGFCRQKLAKYKSPKEIIFIDSLPKSGVGKVMRRELRARLAEPKAVSESASTALP
jgi:long-chain acyl-CoA synthetase